MAALKELGRQVAEAVVRGEFEWARQLTESAIQLRTSEPFLSEVDLLPKRALASDS